MGVTELQKQQIIKSEKTIQQLCHQVTNLIEQNSGLLVLLKKYNCEEESNKILYEAMDSLCEVTTC